jgi:hypothetical protein
MNFDDLKDRLSSELKTTWDRIQESSLYNKLKDRYENLSPSMQKVTMIAAVVLVVALIFSFPLSYYSQSSTYVSEFEEKRDVIRELLKISREASDVPDLAQPPPVEQLKSMAESQARAANLLPEQIASIEVGSSDSKLIPANLSAGSLSVSLNKLNLRQVVDLGYQLQSMNASVKMQDLLITANREDVHYFDVVYKLIALAVPSAISIPEPEPVRGGRGTKTPKDEE